MSARLYFLLLGFLAVAAALIYGSFRAVLFLKPSLIALAKALGG